MNTVKFKSSMNTRIFFGVLALCQASLATGPIVKTLSGKVMGFEASSRDGQTYQAWTSIPYAQPPVGPLRLKAPKPIGKWDGILNATKPMKSCLQRTFEGKYEGQEDCLRLNVFRPKCRWSLLGKLDSNRTMPVLVYVYGGGFLAGSAPGTEHADYIMDEEAALLVTFHYRLGGFGFMSLGDTVLPGNFGLKDQVMALRWVKDNIAAFGGNPDSITVFGESAGGSSAQFLLKSPATEGIVSRAVSDSGAINRIWSMEEVDYARNNTLAVAEALNCTRPSSQEILECLQKVDAQEMLQAVVQNYDEDPTRFAFLPVIEPVGSEQAFATENLAVRTSTKPWITSVTNGEYHFLADEFSALPKETFNKLTNNMTEYLTNLLARYVDDPAKIRTGVRILLDTYFPSGSSTNLPYKLAKMYEAASFHFPAIMNLVFHRGPKWMYHFEYPSQGLADAPHASETVFYFRTNGSDLDPAGYEVSKRLIKRLVNLAYLDDPSPKGSPVEWPQFKETEILRVTAKGDFMAEPETVDVLLKSSNTWVSILGWP